MTNQRFWVGAAAGVVALVVAAFVVGRTRPPPEDPPAAPEPPVAAPADLVADAVLATPDATWRKAQLAVGGVVMLAPPTFGGVLAAYAGAPELAPQVDGSMPVYAALADGGAWVVAAHVVSRARTREALVGGDAGMMRFTADGEAGKLEFFKPVNPAAGGAWAALSHDYVVVGSSRHALDALAAYAYRTLPTRPPNAAAIWATATHAGVSGFLHAAVERAWSDRRKFLLDKDEEARREHGGRAPDLADPKPLVAAAGVVVDRYLAAFGAMQSGEATLDVEDNNLTLRIDLVPPPGDNVAAKWLADWHGGSTAPLVAQDADAVATLFWRTSAEERVDAAKETSATLKEALGARVPARAQTDLAALIARVADKRGDWATLSFHSGVAPGLLLQLASPRPTELSPAIDQLFDMAHNPGLAPWLGSAAGIKGVKIETHDFAGFGAGKRARTQREGTPIDVGWIARGDEIDIGGGTDCDALFAALSPKKHYADEPAVAQPVSALGSDVAWALVARPLLGAASPRSDAELLALAKGEGRARLTFRTTGPLLRQLLAALDLP